MSLELKSLSEINSESANFVLEKFLPIPKNAVTLLSASGGTGKTRLSLIMADRYVKENPGANVALWLTEDYPGQVRHTFDDMSAHRLVDKDSMHFMKLIINEPPQLAKREQGLFKANYQEINAIGESLMLHKISFAVFDPLLAFYGGNENDNSEARVFIQSFAEWAKNYQITTLIIHHSNKDGNSRGASAFHDGVRARYEMGYILDDKDEVDADQMRQGKRIVQLKKDNWGIRKHLWKLSDGLDEICLQVAPPLIQYSREIIPQVNTMDDPMRSIM